MPVTSLRKAYVRPPEVAKIKIKIKIKINGNGNGNGNSNSRRMGTARITVYYWPFS
ncbi:hypothetical protein [Pseudomonas putida]|uniref:hypothetical protein n=1 Tax=Pseudomonas putida TaxID=303 RepID=UPI000A5FF848|nr:hypothetical protein [Pseudomonas putida]